MKYIKSLIFVSVVKNYLSITCNTSSFVYTWKNIGLHPPTPPFPPALIFSFWSGEFNNAGEDALVAYLKEIQIILRLFLVIAMYCQASSSQFFSITQPLTLLAGWEGSLGTCSR